MKIGVVTKIPTDFNKAFSDQQEGFAYWGKGQLRNAAYGHG